VKEPVKGKYVVVDERSTTGWAAYVPELPGLGVAGRTRKHVVNLIREGIRFHLEDLKRDLDSKAKSEKPRANG
jgi:predicted RNase H-like HicB family nuclease